MPSSADAYALGMRVAVPVTMPHQLFDPRKSIISGVMTWLFMQLQVRALRKRCCPVVALSLAAIVLVPMQGTCIRMSSIMSVLPSSLGFDCLESGGCATWVWLYIVLRTLGLDAVVVVVVVALP